MTLDTITGSLCDGTAPTLSRSAMILLALVLALSGFAAIRRWGM